MLYIKDKITLDKSFTTNEYLCYLGFTMLLKKEISEYYVNTKLLSYSLTNTYPLDANLIKNINDSILGLFNKSLITKIATVIWTFLLI